MVEYVLYQWAINPAHLIYPFIFFISVAKHPFFKFIVILCLFPFPVSNNQTCNSLSFMKTALLQLL